ncbi:MAG: hypothetical protein ACSHX8_14645 [Opitutaceae bacterium]
MARMQLARDFLRETPTTEDELRDLLVEHGAKVVATNDTPCNEHSEVCNHFDSITHNGTGNHSKICNLNHLLYQLHQFSNKADVDDVNHELSQIALFLNPPGHGTRSNFTAYFANISFQKKKKCKCRDVSCYPVVFEALDKTGVYGDYAKYGVDLRVNVAREHTYAKIKEEIQHFDNVISKSKKKDRRSIITDRKTPWTPGDEFRFYDFKRVELNRLLLLGLLVSGVLFCVAGNMRLSGFHMPSTCSILFAKRLDLKSGSKVRTAYNCDPSVLMLSNRWLFLVVSMILTVQVFQFFERKELWIEAYLNHPLSLLIILFFSGALLTICSNREPDASRAYCFAGYSTYFRHYCTLLLCVLIAASIVIWYSWLRLVPSHPSRAIGQIIISLIFIAWVLILFFKQLNQLSPIMCKFEPSSGQPQDVQIGENKWLLISAAGFEGKLLLDVCTIAVTILFAITGIQVAL